MVCNDMLHQEDPWGWIYVLCSVNAVSEFRVIILLMYSWAYETARVFVVKIKQVRTVVYSYYQYQHCSTSC